MRIEVYTDGACSGNPGPGGYAFVLRATGNDMKVWGYEDNTTNNKMELTAVVKGLKQALSIWVHDKREIIIYSDSAYIIQAVNQGWIIFWASNGWKKKDGIELKNKELWQSLFELMNKNKSKNKVKFVKVKGHSGNPMNELADSLARMAIKDLNASKAPSSR